MKNRIADTLRRLETLHPKLIDLELGRTQRLLAKLGDPHQALPPTIHIAGTNGKGSVLAFLRSILAVGGGRVHAYSSPHLIRFNERIELAGEPVSDAALADLLDEVETVNGGDPITIFEIITCAAFLAFSRVGADWLILETGLGGRFDATNVIEAPTLTAITPVSLDHQNFLGTTLAEIAREKAGILKPGVPVAIGLQDDAALTQINARITEISASSWLRGPDWQIEFRDNIARYRSSNLDVSLAKLGLFGAHQVDNAALAVAISERLAINPANIEPGLAAARWPGRLQRLRQGKLSALVPADWEVWVDGGHNPAAGAVLGETARSWSQDGKPLYLIFAMLKTKDAAGFLAPLASLTDFLEAVPVSEEEVGYAGGDIVAIAADLCMAARPAASVATALRDLARYGQHPDGQRPARVLICGSLYLAGAVLAA